MTKNCDYGVKLPNKCWICGEETNGSDYCDKCDKELDNEEK